MYNDEPAMNEMVRAPDSGSVTEQVAALRVSAAKLDKLHSIFEDLLSPITRDPDIGQDSAANPEDRLVPIASELRDINNLIAGIGQRFEDLSRRINL